MCLAKALLYGLLSGILQLITLWIAYMGWATMHFCQVLVFLIVLGIDLLFILIDFQRINMLLSGSPILKMLFWFMIIYDIIGLLVGYFAYANFKESFYANHPPGYSMFDAGSLSQYDNPGSNNRGGYQVYNVNANR